MKDLIDRAMAIDALDKRFDSIPMEQTMEILQLRKDLRELPSAQPERKRGRWNITDAYPHNVYCSECYTRFAQTHWAVWEDGSLPRNFCPNCGADMREDEQE